MTSPEDLPADIRQFILERIDSVPHLEALLLVWEQPVADWTEETLAHSLYVEPTVAKQVIHDLLRRGWIKRRQDSGNGYTFDAAWDSDGAFMRRLSTTYRQQLIRVATLIHSNASSAVRDFAAAFQLKKN